MNSHDIERTAEALIVVAFFGVVLLPFILIWAIWRWLRKGAD